MKDKKILEICNFSAGISGVWTRVYEESKRLARNNEVHVFSSNLENDKITSKNHETIDGIKIKRFPVRNRMGFALFFDFEKEALKLKPDVIICHGYRKPYLNQAIKVARKLNIPCYLVTHAPFVEQELRSRRLNFIISIYDKIYGRKILNSFNKVISITKWEIPYLLRLGANKNKIEYIPNGISEEFFETKQKKSKKQSNRYIKLLFLGRVTPIKDIEILIRAIPLLKNDEVKVEIVGPPEENYLFYLKQLINQLNIKDRIIFTPAIYNLNKKIEKIDSADAFILPSKREAMPQSLIEAMARQKIVISSNTKGGKEIINDGKNGFLFQRGDYKELAAKIDFCFSAKNTHRVNKMKKEAKKSVEKYNWSTLISLIERTYNKA